MAFAWPATTATMSSAERCRQVVHRRQAMPWVMGLRLGAGEALHELVADAAGVQVVEHEHGPHAGEPGASTRPLMMGTRCSSAVQRQVWRQLASRSHENLGRRRSWPSSWVECESSRACAHEGISRHSRRCAPASLSGCTPGLSRRTGTRRSYARSRARHDEERAESFSAGRGLRSYAGGRRRPSCSGAGRRGPSPASPSSRRSLHRP